MAYTLADYAKLATSPLKAGVIDIIRGASPLAEAFTWEDAAALSIEIVRTAGLPTVGSRKIGGTFADTKGRFDIVKERLVNIGGKIDIDKILARAKTIQDQRSTHTEMMVKAMGLYFNSVFITGTPSSDYDSLVGLRWRCQNELSASMSLAGGGLDISPDASGLADNRTRMIDLLHEFCSLVGYGDGGPTHLLMNRQAKQRIESVLRWGGALSTTEDAYGRTFNTFGSGGPALVDIGGTDPLDLTSQIIGNVENVDGNTLTGGASTTIFGVKIGGTEYLNGWQEYPMDVNDIGLLEDGVTERTVVDWPLGIYYTSPFSFGRLHGIVAA